MDDIRSRIVAWLERCYPPTLAGWEDRPAQDSGAHHDSDCPDPSSVVHLAREYDIPQVLLSAFYTLATARADPTGEEPIWEPSRAEDAATTGIRWDLLSRSDLFRLLRGRERLGSWALRIIRDHTANDDREMGCTVHHISCKVTYPRVQRDFKPPLLADNTQLILAGRPDPLKLLKTLFESVCAQGRVGICSSGTDNLERYIVQQMYQIWDELTKVFDL